MGSDRLRLVGSVDMESAGCLLDGELRLRRDPLWVIGLSCRSVDKASGGGLFELAILA